jgi:hypothetical protein
MKRKICCINIEIHHYSISPNSDNTSLFKRIINRKGQEDQSLQRLLAIFPLFLFLTQIEPFLPTSFLMPIIKRKEKKRKDG